MIFFDLRRKGNEHFEKSVQTPGFSLKIFGVLQITNTISYRS